MRAKSNHILLLTLCWSTLIFGQMDSYEYKQQLIGINDQWHKIPLPNSVFENVRQDLRDIRIYGITEKDTLEAPYLLKIASGNHIKKLVDFKRLNTSSNAKGHYYTYEIPTSEPIDQIKLDFKNNNFDWLINLQGSHDQNEWFTILEDYRILSLKNGQTDYKFTDLNLPKSKYRYYRIWVKTSTLPQLLSAKINHYERVEATYRDCPIENYQIDQKGKQTFIQIDLKHRSPISFLQIDVKEDVDYYRPVHLEYVFDSVATEKGIKYSYRHLASGILNSIEKNVFSFSSTLTKKIRISIQNDDNRPLEIGKVTVKGYEHELIARFDKLADYYMTYGKQNSRAPVYDIAKANTNIPLNNGTLTLGAIQIIPKIHRPGKTPLFENKLWLWGIMGVIILALGGFTLKMIRTRQ